MIARRVPTRGGKPGKAGSGFGRLAKYVTSEAKGATGAKSDDQASGADALGAYVADQGRHAGRVEWTRITNCGTDTDTRLATQEIMATQAANKRGRSDPNYHLIVSFPPGERPSREQIEDIEDELVAVLGMTDHQRISALHDDKAHLHLHVAINRVHPESLKLAGNHQDKRKLAEAATMLEAKHGLTRTNHAIPGDKVIRADPDTATGIHGGRQSFAEWVKENAAAPLLAARDQGGGWQSFHNTAARYGLTVKPRGAGLVVVSEGGMQPSRPTAVRASAIDRGLTMKALTDRLGPYEAPAGQKPRPTMTYGREAPAAGQAGGLWATFKTEQDAGRAARTSALDARRAIEERYRVELQAHYGAAFADLSRARFASGIDPKIRAEMLKKERAGVMETFKANNKAARAAIFERHPSQGWKEWLIERSQAGDKDAARVLRKMDAKAGGVQADIASSPDRAAGIALMATRKPSVGKDGSIYYRLDDGGMVKETKAGIALPQPSAAAAVLALEMAREKYGSAKITVADNPALRAALIEAASLPGVAVRFSDPAMEAARERRAAERRVDSGRAGRRPDADPAIGAWIDEQNGKAQEGVAFRERQPTDAGRARFDGIRQVGPNVRAALWTIGKTTLVEKMSEKKPGIGYKLQPGTHTELGATATDHDIVTGAEQEIDHDE